MAHIQTYKDAAGEHRWRIVAANNRIIAVSGEGYKNKGDMWHGISQVSEALGATPAQEPDNPADRSDDGGAIGRMTGRE